ncbi:DUF3784 domain-containing protein [Clostridium sp. Sa3CUN1]|uniref:DUF3784 domain-containing protein n=1 Tax=Clostridium gallinarum TaxID=2762246 RepID=A0ABR8Q3V2_9CLOT|nr:DUF3784 domain-containing protein [Clostridium gallinarum]MBD7915086.1 DUF3784 domain-containing protein [Clostridium gallinarum]
MRNVDIYGLVMITIFIGGFFTFLGWVIKSQNAGDMLNGFDAKKYNKDKVSMIIGRDMLNVGLLVIFLGIIGMFLSSKFYNYITFSQISIFLLGIIKIMYDMDKKCRRKR